MPVTKVVPGAKLVLPANCRSFHEPPQVTRVLLEGAPNWFNYLLVEKVGDPRDINRVGELVVSFKQEALGRVINTLSVDAAFRQPDRVFERLERASGVLETGTELIELLRSIGLNAGLRTAENAEAAVAALKFYSANFLARARTGHRITGGTKAAMAARLRDRLGRENWGMVCACATSAIEHHAKQSDLEVIYKARNGERRQAADALLRECDNDVMALLTILDDEHPSAYEIAAVLEYLMIKPYFFASIYTESLIFVNDEYVDPDEETVELIRAAFMFEAAIMDMSTLLSSLEHDPKKLDTHTSAILRYIILEQIDFDTCYERLFNKLREPLAELIAASGVSDLGNRGKLIKRHRATFVRISRNRLSDNSSPWSMQPFLY